MKVSLTNTLYSALFAVALTACQSNTYQINGTIEGAADGDTLFLTSDMQTGAPNDTIVVKNGKFSLSGEADSIHLSIIYCAKRNEINAPFFIEPGTITLTLKEMPGSSRVGGTKCNDEWQELNDSVMTIGKQINQIAEQVYGKHLEEPEQKNAMAIIENLNRHFSAIVVKKVEENISNEFGFFLLTYYPQELIDDNTRLRLIKELPAEMRQRPAIQQFEQMIAAAAKTGEGANISDFSQPAPNGSQLSIMSIISNNKITIIDFWASWCGPCRQDIPFVIKLYNVYKDKGLGIVGISLDEDKDSWLMATKQLNIPWPQMSDLKGWDNAAAREFNITSIPHTIIVNQQGKILRRGLRGETLAAFVAEQLQ